MLHELHKTRRTRPVHSLILNETIAGVTDILGRELGGIMVERAVIGLFFTGVKLAAGVAGTCATPRDAFDATAFHDRDRVVLVGAFIPFLKELKRRRQSYLVLEQNPAALKPEEMPFYRPAELAAEIVPSADVLLITGATLLNDTLEDLLALARPEARVTVLGPTVGMLPDAFLARGADVLGSVRITQPDAFLDLLAEGGSAPHFLGRLAEKIVLARKPAGVRANVA